MKKIIWKELKEDDPIFKQGFIMSSHNRKLKDYPIKCIYINIL